MTLISHPGSWQQMALASPRAGIARGIALMLAGARAVLDWLASSAAPPAARQPAAILEDTGSPCTLHGLAGAAGTAARLSLAVRDALPGVPGRIIPGS
jgi:hypothetical protein